MEPRYLHIGHYTKELKRRLPAEYFRPVPSRLLWMLPHLLIAAGGIIAIATLPWSWIGKLLLAIPIGSAYACLGLLGHEVLHGSIVRTPWLRNTLGFICFMPFNLGPHLWRKWHNVEHHGHTQHEHRDPDRVATLSEYEVRPGFRGLLFRLPPFLQSVATFLAFSVWFSLYSFNMLLRFRTVFEPRKQLAVVSQFALSAAFWIGLLILIGPYNFVFAYGIPILIANFIVMSYIATNHVLNPITPVNDPLANSLTVIVPRWVDILHLNFSHHTEHHLFPAMSPRYAPKVKALIKELWPERYHEMPHWKALRLIWSTPRLYADEISLVDPVRDDRQPVLGYGLDPDAPPRRA